MDDDQPKRLGFVSLLEYAFLFSLPALFITVAVLMWLPWFYGFFFQATHRN